MINLSKLHDYLASRNSCVEGLTLPDSDSTVADVEIQFKAGSKAAEKTKAKADLNALVGQPLPWEYADKRKKEYADKLGTPEDQLDALYKGLEIIIPALIEGRALTAQEAALVTPDKTQPADTPAGWRGKVKDIKERFPKD